MTILPIALPDSYTVFQAGDSFDAAPLPLRIDVPGRHENRSLGVLFNDYSFHHRELSVTHIRVETPLLELPELGSGDWLPLVESEKCSRATRTIVDPRLHGEITVFANGDFAFVPAENDSYWKVDKHSVEPIPVYVQYRVSDGFDSAVSRFGIGHGHYRRGGHHDGKHDGSAMYFLGGGGNGEPF